MSLPPEDSSPRLGSVGFGIDYSPNVIVTAFGPIAEFETVVGNFPVAGTGTSLLWFTPGTETIQEVCWSTGYEYYGEAGSFDLTPHPELGGFFWDDADPPNPDPIADYGRLGFNTDPGYLPCPQPLSQVPEVTAPSGEGAMSRSFVVARWL